MAQGPAMIASGRRLPKRTGPAVTTALSWGKASLMGMAYRDWPIAESPGAGTPERLAPSAQGCGFVVLVLVIPPRGERGALVGFRASDGAREEGQGGTTVRRIRGAPRARRFDPCASAPASSAGTHDSGSKRCRAALLSRRRPKATSARERT